MTSWEIIKADFTENERAGSLGYLRAVNAAARLFVRLRHDLNDWKAAVELFNADLEVRKALLTKAEFQGLEDAGVLTPR